MQAVERLVDARGSAVAASLVQELNGTVGATLGRCEQLAAATRQELQQQLQELQQLRLQELQQQLQHGAVSAVEGNVEAETEATLLLGALEERVAAAEVVQHELETIVATHVATQGETIRATSASVESIQMEARQQAQQLATFATSWAVAVGRRDTLQAALGTLAQQVFSLPCTRVCAILIDCHSRPA
eukprot:SAG11_NODE_1781_length_4262_cov_5.146049_1_plen_188_part_00